jgi:hypothetical protein
MFRAIAAHVAARPPDVQSLCLKLATSFDEADSGKLCVNRTDWQDKLMALSWKESIYLQREQLARMLSDPLSQLAEECAQAWGDREQLNTVLLRGFSGIPYCTYLYCIDTDCVQICDNVDQSGLVTGHFGRDRSQRPYMKEAVPNAGLSGCRFRLTQSAGDLGTL